MPLMYKNSVFRSLKWFQLSLDNWGIQRQSNWGERNSNKTLTGSHNNRVILRVAWNSKRPAWRTLHSKLAQIHALRRWWQQLKKPCAWVWKGESPHWVQTMVFEVLIKPNYNPMESHVLVQEAIRKTSWIKVLTNQGEASGLWNKIARAWDLLLDGTQHQMLIQTWLQKGQDLSHGIFPKVNISFLTPSDVILPCAMVDLAGGRFTNF